MNCRRLHSSKGHAWACWLLFLLLGARCAAVANFDAIPLIREPAQQLTATDLSEVLKTLLGILAQHNRRFESPALGQYVEQLQAVLQPDCCDYFTAVILAKGITSALSEVLELRLPAALRPVVRRSYVAAVWLLQRSKLFRWSTTSLQQVTLSGLFKLYEVHMDAAAGKPIKFHHVSKTGGTSLCSVAWDNGCRGPGMSKRDNCLLDLVNDRPVWVLRHNVTLENAVASIPEPPPPPPAAANSPEEAEQLRMLAVIRTQRLASRVFDWWMYECPADRLVGHVGRPCDEVQEHAISKSATFLASENAVPTQHGVPQVCEAFTNIIVVREALGQAASLMAEVSLVYTRLLKRSRVVGWSPPRSDLSWWKQWAPVVVNSYATRTLLGAPGYCPAAGAAEADPTRGAVWEPGPGSFVRQVLSTSDPSSSSRGSGGSNDGSGSSSDSSSSGSSAGWLVSDADTQRAQRLLASFDVVLDLGNLQLMDASLSKLLGWSTKSYSKGRHQRIYHAVNAPSWQHLELLARQVSPPLNDSILLLHAVDNSSSSSRSSGASGVGPAARQQGASASGGQARNAQNEQQQQQLVSHAPWTAGGGSSNSILPLALNDSDIDTLRRLIGEARVRQLYSSHGLKGVLLPALAEVPLLQPPAAVTTAAMDALTAVFQAPLTVSNETTNGDGWHLVVTLHLAQQEPAGASSTAAAAQAAAGVGGTAARLSQPRADPTGPGGAAAAAAAEGQQLASYHVWPSHEVVLSAVQYQQLLRATAADTALYSVARVLQLLDAAWVSVVGQQRRMRKMMLQLQEESAGACGFAGLNHLQ